MANLDRDNASQLYALLGELKASIQTAKRDED
jgi:hypothetical protein